MTLGRNYLKIESNEYVLDVHGEEDEGNFVFWDNLGKREVLYNPYDWRSISVFWSVGVPYRALSVEELMTTAVEKLKSESTPYYENSLPGFFEQLEPKALVNAARKLGLSLDEIKGLLPFSGARLEDEVILIEPSQMLLGHTIEIIGGRNVVSTTISGKSTTGRTGLEICNDANLGSPGFIGQWVLEIRNKFSRNGMFLLVGTQLATIQFWELTELPMRQYSGQYLEQKAEVRGFLLPKPLKRS